MPSILSTIPGFQKQILDYYYSHGRQMPWRENIDPYHIFISEIMLQQTQVSRVEEKFKQFILKFPSFEMLNKASLASVYSVWQGLGYNRRAMYLKKAAQCIVEEYNGTLPNGENELLSLPGIGKATAASIRAFAFNSPVVFIETNIRTVFIHFFFKNKTKVSDEEILPLVKKSLYVINPRIWYWALMDYGTMLKKNGLDKNAKSIHYIKQSAFEGSWRQKRGAILKKLAQVKIATSGFLAKELGYNQDVVDEIVNELLKEGFLEKAKSKLKLKSTV